MKTFLVTILIVISSVNNAQTARGRIQIQDGTLVTDQGTLLRGAYDGITPWSTLSPREYITQIKEYGLNCMHFYAEGPEHYYVGENQEYVDSIVKWTGEDSLYLVITASWLINYDEEGNLIMEPDIDFIREFWRHYAPRYKDETHVIYEIANEPFFDLSYPFTETYDSLTLAMERSVYDTIRTYAPETHVQFMSYWVNPVTYDFMQDIRGLGEDVDWSNASIASHGYTYSAEDTRSFLRAVRDSGYAVTVTEVPVIRYLLPPALDYANPSFLRILEQEEVSYINFVTPVKLVDNPAVFKTVIENNDIRWDPDFGVWPSNVNTVYYKNPYTPLPAIFCDESSLGMAYVDEFEMQVGDFIPEQESFLVYYNIDFEEGPDSLIIEMSYMELEGSIEVRLDSFDGPLIANCQIPPIPWDSRVKLNFPVSDFSGVHDLYLYFSNPFHNHGILNKFLFTREGVNAQQPPFHGVAFELPCKIEAEDFDYGIQNTSYFDIKTIYDSLFSNNGQYYRSADVDVFATADTGQGHSVGDAMNGEWLEYTVNCSEEIVADIQLRYACIDTRNSIRLLLNNTELGTATLGSTGTWDNWIDEQLTWYTWPYWETVTLDSVTIPAGNNQILRVEFLGASYGSLLNWINFIELDIPADDDPEPDPITVLYPNPAKDYLRIKFNGNAVLELYSLQGQLVKSKQLTEYENTIPVTDIPAGQYVVRVTNRAIIYTELITISN